MEYKLIQERDMLPPHLRLSTVVFEVMYGDLFQSNGHIKPAYIGQLPISYIPQVSYIWFIPSGIERASMLRDAKKLWKEVRKFFHGDLLCFVKEKKNMSFAKAFGFVSFAEENGLTFMKEQVDEL